jgi:hypothetical protein
MRIRVSCSHVSVPTASVSGSGSSAPRRNSSPGWGKNDLRHTSALVMIPPQHTWSAIQEIRCVRDKSYLRWMPHVNLLYPFLEDDSEGMNFADAARICAEALADVKSFQCALIDFDFFAHTKSSMVWLQPSDVAVDTIRSVGVVDSTGAIRTGVDNSEVTPRTCSALLASQKKLERAFPFANDLSVISEKGFTPHVSLGQWPCAVSANAATANLHASWRPIQFEVDAFYLISRSSAGDDAFRVKARIPLNGGDVQFVETECSMDDDTNDTKYSMHSDSEQHVEPRNSWWREPYTPHTPPLGARCLMPKRRGRRGRG